MLLRVRYFLLYYKIKETEGLSGKYGSLVVQFCWEREAIESAKCKTHPVMQQGALSDDGAKRKITTQNLKQKG